MKSLVVAVTLAALTIPAMAVAQDSMQPIPNPPEREHHSMHHMMRHMKHAMHRMMHHSKHHDDKGHK